MEQNSQNQNKNEGLFQKNQILIAVGVIIVLAVIIFFATKGKNQQTADNTGADQNSEQVAGENTSAQEEMDQGQADDANGQDDANQASTPNGDTQAPSTMGNVSAAGTLAASDNAARGNLMIQSDQGKIYIATKRDFSALLGTSVTLQASGTINDFVFLGFAESSDSDKGGERDQTPPATKTDNVSFDGQLQTSDNTATGNYQIVSGATKVYLQTVHDYSAWLGADVDLSATGTLQSFTGAILTKK